MSSGIASGAGAKAPGYLPGTPLHLETWEGRGIRERHFKSLRGRTGHWQNSRDTETATFPDIQVFEIPRFRRARYVFKKDLRLGLSLDNFRHRRHDAMRKKERTMYCNGQYLGDKGPSHKERQRAIPGRQKTRKATHDQYPGDKGLVSDQRRLIARQQATWSAVTGETDVQCEYELPTSAIWSA